MVGDGLWADRHVIQLCSSYKQRASCYNKKLIRGLLTQSFPVPHQGSRPIGSKIQQQLRPNRIS